MEFTAARDHMGSDCHQVTVRRIQVVSSAIRNLGGRASVSSEYAVIRELLLCAGDGNLRNAYRFVFWGFGIALFVSRAAGSGQNSMTLRNSG